MRFKTDIKNVRTFSRLVSALGSLEKIAWVRLDDDTARFTVIPGTGSQVWASIAIDILFDRYTIVSNLEGNTINFELPLAPLQRALKSAFNATDANMRLTKRDGNSVLCLTIHTTTNSTNPRGGQNNRRGFGPGIEDDDNPESLELPAARREREKVITHDIPVRVLHPESVEEIMQPKVSEPEVNITFPPLLQLKAISDRFVKLAAQSGPSGNALQSARGFSTGGGGGGAGGPKLEISANMHGSLRMRVAAEGLDIESVWRGLENPELDADALPMPIDEHPSTRMRNQGPDAWATVRVDGKDWSKVLSVGRLEGRVIGCFNDDNSLILYAFVPGADDLPGAQGSDSVLTYYVTSYSS